MFPIIIWHSVFIHDYYIWHQHMSIDTYFKEGEHYYVSKESCSVNLFEKSSAKARKRNANFCWNEKVVGLLCKVFKKAVSDEQNGD